MVEKILEQIVDEMASHLDRGQLEHLSNVLYVNFHGLGVRKQCTELAATGMDLRYYYGVMREQRGIKMSTMQTREQEGLEEHPLFVTLDKPHNRLTVTGIQYMLRQLGKRAGVKNTRPHRFRRTIATDLLNRGMPIEQVKEQQREMLP